MKKGWIACEYMEIMMIITHARIHTQKAALGKSTDVTSKADQCTLTRN